MIVGITGASGFVGRALSDRLSKTGLTVQPISTRGQIDSAALAGCNAVVHLAGETVGQRWTGAIKKRIEESRIEGTKALVDAMLPHPPQVLISASAVGYYGSRGDEVLTEESSPASDFLGRVAQGWEREARVAESLGTRVVPLRFGMVLGRGGGGFQRMLPPFKLGLGGRLGSGDQWMSWIHINDLVSLIQFVINESTLRGVFNATAPHPVRNSEFTRALGSAVHRPAILPVPEFALRLLFGEMAEMLLGSQRAIPEAALRAGFTFAYPDIFGALAQIVASS